MVTRPDVMPGRAEAGTILADEPSVVSAARQSLELATRYLTGLQDGRGWWQGELETNVTMDAEDLLLREFLGIRTDEETAAAARWIASRQRADGTWANFHDGPADLSTTVEAYVALRLAGHQPGAPHMSEAASWIRAQGGIEATRVFTRIWLALFGEWPWAELPVMPPEMIYFPAWFPLNVYDWGCWARQTIVPLTVVCSLRPVRRTRAARGRRPVTPGGPRSAALTGCCTATSATSGAWPRPGGREPPPCAGVRTGSSPGKNETDAGAASSRRGSTP
jgi:squalene-hopene/tetraprenyl-beta-curcumene cyclase